MKLKSLLLLLVASSTLILHAQTDCFDISGKNAAITTFAGLIFTKVLYDYLYSPSDAKKLTHAINLCEQADLLLNDLKSSYEPIMNRIDLFSHTIDKTNEPIEAIIRSAAPTHNFYDFGISLQEDIANLMEFERNIYNAKINIEGRRDQHITIIEDASRDEILRIKKTTINYTLALEKITLTLMNLDFLRSSLQTLKNIVISNSHYTLEYHQACLEGRRKHEPSKNQREDCICSYQSSESESTDHSDDSWRKYSALPTVRNESETPTNTQQQNTVWHDRFCKIGDIFNG